MAFGQHKAESEILRHSLLWESVRLGDKQAFFDLYKSLSRDLTRFGLRVCPDVELVSDTLNQLFISLWEKHARLDQVELVESYLRTILKRKIFKALKQKQRLENAIALFGQEEALTELSYEEIIVKVQSDELMIKRLKHALEKLTFKQRQLVQLRFYEGMSYEQIAEITQLSVRTAYNTIYEALKLLRCELHI